MNDLTMDALLKRVQKLEDIEAIKELKAQYAAACDDFYNPDKMGEIFTKDAVWDGETIGFGRHQGRQVIQDFFANASADIDFAVHYFLQPQIKLADDGQSATASWYLWQACTIKGEKLWLSALEHDEYIKIDGRWWQSSMILEPFFLSPYEKGWDNYKAEEVLTVKNGAAG